MNYTLSEYEDVYEVRREGSDAVAGFIQRKGGQWTLNISSSCGWLTEEEVKSLSARLSLLNMRKDVASNPGEWYHGYTA